MDRDQVFPLVKRALERGILGQGNWLVVAPTATGKSHLARLVIEHALASGEDGLNLYLVPYRALARQVYEDMEQALQGRDGIRLRIATGDSTDPVDAAASDVVVATYERALSLLADDRVRLGTVVADEFHIVGDPTRGPMAESLVARLLRWRRPRRFLALSAVIEEPGEIEAWLGARLVLGHAHDRQVPVEYGLVTCASARDAAIRLIVEAVGQGKQVLAFCATKPRAVALARDLRAALPALDARQRAALRSLREEIEQREREEELDLEESLREALSAGIAWHHAGLAREERRLVERAFAERLLRVITCTPTLAAGVNLPADLVLVVNATRPSYVRGRYVPVYIGRSQILNMLGRAGRPGLVEAGRGLLLLEEEEHEAVEDGDLENALTKGVGDRLASQLPHNIDGLLRVVLGAVADRGAMTWDELLELFRGTLWYREEGSSLGEIRPLAEDMMEDLPSWERARREYGQTFLTEARVRADGVEVTVRKAEGSSYTVTLLLDRVGCTCPAARRWHRHEICKHAARVIYDLLLGRDFEEEVHDRALYVCLRFFHRTLDPATKLRKALDLLTRWGFLARETPRWRVTELGRAAAHSIFDLLLLRGAASRVDRAAGEVSSEDVVRWAVEDYLGDEDGAARWLAAIAAWIGEDDLRLPARVTRGDFERTLEDLARLCGLYESLARARGMEALVGAARRAAGRLEHGVRDDLLDLARLRLRGVRRRRLRYLHDERGLRKLGDLAEADPEAIADPRRFPLALARQAVERARRLLRLRDEPPEITDLDTLLAWGAQAQAG